MAVSPTSGPTTTLSGSDTSRSLRPALARAQRRAERGPRPAPSAFKAQVSPAQALKQATAFCVLLGTILFNFFLAMVNQSGFGISETHVILAEIMLVAVAVLLVLDRRLGFYLVLATLLSYFVMLNLMKGFLDPKPIRDALIPIVFFFLGTRLASLRVVDWVLGAALAIALVFGLFEAFAVADYIDLVNPLGYYVAKGSLEIVDLRDGNAVGLYYNGVRYAERTLFQFLGSHRVSGIFLEPVSVGNFCAIAASWFVIRHWGKPLVILPLMIPVIVLLGLADARFGMYTMLVTLAALPFARIIPPLSIAIIPVLVLVAQISVGIASEGLAWDNSFTGRLIWGGQLLTNMTPQMVFGVDPNETFLHDTGYGYMFSNIGIIGAIALWIALLILPARGLRFARFKLFAALYVTLLLVVSSSLFSIKTGGLLWFILGTLYALDRLEFGGERAPNPTFDMTGKRSLSLTRPVVRRALIRQGSL